ncbi:hypothetical protein ACRUKB_26960, partial [Burkholderia pseudomallei]
MVGIGLRRPERNKAVKRSLPVIVGNRRRSLGAERRRRADAAAMPLRCRDASATRRSGARRAAPWR